MLPIAPARKVQGLIKGKGDVPIEMSEGFSGKLDGNSEKTPPGHGSRIHLTGAGLGLRGAKLTAFI
jgi:hypothetical protein